MQQIQHQQNYIGLIPQQMPPQQQTYQNYHQVQAAHPNMPPVSLAASPHSHTHSHLQQQPQPYHNHQSTMQGPPQHHNLGRPIHMQQPPQQHPNQMIRPQVTMNLPQAGHHKNFISGGSIPQSNSHLYPQNHQSQQHIHHQHQSPVIQNGPPLVSPSPHNQRNSPHHVISPTELRIIELNRRLQSRPLSRNPNPLPSSIDESLWWEKFASEFFEDDASLTVRVHDDKPIEYTIGRTLIPRFFKTHFDGGVTDLSISLRNPKEVSLHPQTLTLDCDKALITTNNILKDQAVVVQTEGHLMIEFMSNNFDNLSIKSWRFITRGHREYVDRTILATMSMHNSPATIQGLTKSTNAYLKMCMIMEPMQDLMVQHRRSNLRPRDCLQRFLLENYNFKSEGDIRVTKRRKRKPAAAPSVAGAANTKKSRPSNFSPASQEIMVVGEPSMLGSDFGDENERHITRLENNQFDGLEVKPNINGLNGTSNSDDTASVTTPD